MRSEIGAIIKQYTPRDPRMESGVAGVPEMPTGPFTREGRRDNVTKAGAGAWHLACGQTHLMTTCHEIDPVLFVRPAAASFRLLSSARATAVGRGAGDPRHSAEQSSRACTMWQMSVNGQSRSFVLRNRRAPPHAASGADLQTESKPRVYSPSIQATGARTRPGGTTTPGGARQQPTSQTRVGTVA